MHFFVASVMLLAAYAIATNAFGYYQAEAQRAASAPAELGDSM